MGRILAIFLILLAIPSLARAHEMRPAVLDVVELGDHRYDVAWSGASADDLTLTLPADCARQEGTPRRFVLRCAESLAGRAITARGLGPTHPDALVRFSGLTGPSGGAPTVTAVLTANGPTFVVPSPAKPRGDRLARARSYLSAGALHVARGADHLLFVLGLLLLVRGPRGVVRAVTAFTVAHSLTLALAVTAAVRLPTGPVEATIALSLVVLAGELARADPGQAPTLARRYPSSLAFAFGLLHGFGFAGGLAALRVPSADLPLALLGFNLGVEAGQLAFVALSLAAMALIRRTIGPERPKRLAWIPVYVIGSMGAYYLLDRLPQLWSA
jgi:hypothetical protein